MTLQDWIGTGQIAILFVTAIIIAWYSYETRLIRKETTKQNLILAEQVLMMQESIKAQISLVLPIFRYNGGSRDRDHANLNLLNIGGAATKLLVRPLGKFRATIQPSSAIGTNEQATVTLVASDLSKIDNPIIEVEFQDKLAHSHTKRFRFTYDSNLLREEETAKPVA